MASYGSSFFPSFYGQNKTRRTKRGSIPCRTDGANEANKMFVFGFVDDSAKETNLFEVSTGVNFCF